MKEEKGMREFFGCNKKSAVIQLNSLLFLDHGICSLTIFENLMDRIAIPQIFTNFVINLMTSRANFSVTNRLQTLTDSEKQNFSAGFYKK